MPAIIVKASLKIQIFRSTVYSVSDEWVKRLKVWNIVIFGYVLKMMLTSIPVKRFSNHCHDSPSEMLCPRDMDDVLLGF